MEEYLVLDQQIYDGVQKVYEFPNGKRVSVVSHQFSYGGSHGLWELYDYHNDPTGFLTWERYWNYLKRLKT